MVFLVCAGCDQGDGAFDPAVGPPLHVVATSPSAEQGTDCVADGPRDCGVPVTARIELRFDRFLAPHTISRSLVELYTGNRTFIVGLVPTYDVLERVLVFRPGGALIAGALYTVEIKLPDEDGQGLSAFDGALLEAGPVPLRYHFFTAREPSALHAREPSAAGAAALEQAPDCGQVLGAFQRSGCADAGCHMGGSSALGLDLSTRAGLAATAAGRVARQTDLGTGQGLVLENPARFGVGMARIHPFKPENSYLIYKLLRNRENFRWAEDGDACRSAYGVGLPRGACAAPPEEELERLRDWFVLGDAMPTGPKAAMTREQLGSVHAWIAAGANCSD